MRLFSKRGKRPVAVVPTVLAAKISANMGKYHTKVAEYLNGRTVQLSGKSKIIFLVLVCLLFGGMSLYLLINAFH